MSQPSDWVLLRLGSFTIAVPEDHVEHIEWLGTNLVDEGFVDAHGSSYCIDDSLQLCTPQPGKHRCLVRIASAEQTLWLVVFGVDSEAYKQIKVFETPPVMAWGNSPLTGIGLSSDGAVFGVATADSLGGFLNDH
ncbi:hypothetical protein [Thiocystis violacea]|uniref:hypothetical protein n=1 Tax=Thiocystis violacea TaxID=13725 RepID=UPI0019079579|nr:hypothetical protein [Thiocystis violacea]MBK1722951.1 hypothetical protein [Thiocystis violacea]